jgi:hypothetical protein
MTSIKAEQASDYDRRDAFGRCSAAATLEPGGSRGGAGGGLCPRRGGERCCTAVQSIDRPDLDLAPSAEAQGWFYAREDSRTCRCTAQRSGGLCNADRARRRPYQRVGIGPALPFDGGVASPALIPIASGVRVWLATGHTDMRRGINALSLMVQETLGRDAYRGDLYVFRGAGGI